jgi:tRNA modification GTPase
VRRVFDQAGQVLDEAMVLRFAAPRSFTGEDVVELHLHGGSAVVAGVLTALGDQGLRPALPGEFTRRAFENGKLDLAQAEAIADLIDAETSGQRLQAMGQLAGALDARFAEWRRLLVSCLALIEAAIDFPDEELPDDLVQRARADIQALRQELADALADGRGEVVRGGFRIALVGAPNAGKSSLFNRLVGRDAAIVTSQAGTTRDIIEANLVVCGFKILLADTAGLRFTDDVVEVEGVRRAQAFAQEAELRLQVFDPGADADSQLIAVRGLMRPGDIVVVNKIDQQVGLWDAAIGPWALPGLRCIGVSCTTGRGLEQLWSLLEGEVSSRLAGREFPAATRQRHKLLLAEAQEQLRWALEQFEGPPELVGENIRLAARSLERLSGRVDPEAILEKVFSSFCIGK